MHHSIISPQILIEVSIVKNLMWRTIMSTYIAVPLNTRTCSSSQPLFVSYHWAKLTEFFFLILMLNVLKNHTTWTKEVLVGCKLIINIFYTITNILHYVMHMSVVIVVHLQRKFVLSNRFQCIQFSCLVSKRGCKFGCLGGT